MAYREYSVSYSCRCDCISYCCCASLWRSAVWWTAVWQDMPAWLTVRMTYFTDKTKTYI